MQPDFIPVAEIARRTGYAVKSLYNQHASGCGPLAPILTRLGAKVGAWTGDYEEWVASQRRLPPRDAA